jgi:flagellar basal-body rod protein FlgC
MTIIDNGRSPAPRIQPPSFPLPADGGPRPLFRVLSIAAGGLSAQRARMEVAAQNIANAETTRTAGGGPYHRKTVALQAVVDPIALPSASDTIGLSVAGRPELFGGDARALIHQLPSAEPTDAGGVRIAGVGEDASEGSLVYDPGHPDANESGYVRMPNVRITDEMMEMMDARRVYDANATVFQSAKAMLRRALEL